MIPLGAGIPATWKGARFAIHDSSSVRFSNSDTAQWVESLGGYSQEVIMDGKVVSTLKDGM